MREMSPGRKRLNQIGCAGFLVMVVVVAVVAYQKTQPGSDDCTAKDSSAKAAYRSARAKVESVDKQVPSLMHITDAIGEALDCDDETCSQGPCARCYWIYQGCTTQGRIYVTVEKWGTPLEVRNGSRVLGIEYSEN